MKQWHSPAELAALKLPGLPATDRAIQMMAKRENWEGRKRAARGGGFEYPVALLPEEAKGAMRAKSIKVRSTALVAQAAATAVAKIDPAGLKTYQRDTMQARAAILAHIDSLVLDGNSQSKAIGTLVAMAKAGELPAELAELLPIANARAGAGRTLSRATLYNWIAVRAEAGCGQIPFDRADEEILERWASIWKIYRKPAAFALGQITFTGNDGMVIDAGTEVQRADGVSYRTTAVAALAGGAATVPAKAAVAGVAGNAIAATKLKMVSTIGGVNTDVVVAVGGMAAGADIEAVADLLARFLARIRQAPHGGAAHDLCGLGA